MYKFMLSKIKDLMSTYEIHVQWNLSKPILIRTKEKYQFRQVIGLDRLTFTEQENIVYKNLKYLHFTKHVL